MLRVFLLIFMCLSLIAAEKKLNTNRHDSRPPVMRPFYPVEMFFKVEQIPEQEKIELLKLAKTDPNELVRKMRLRMKIRRKEYAQCVLNLRQKVLEAKNSQEKTAAMDELKKIIAAETERRLAAQKCFIEETDKMIKRLEKKSESMKSNLAKREAGKQDYIDSFSKSVLSEKIPEHLLRDVNWQEEKKD